jgi:hypothetical protein
MEKRTAIRTPVSKAGAIEFGVGEIGCLVHNISATGAALDVTSAVEIPEHFTLVLPADDRQMSCHVVWRKDARIGIAFD